MTIVSMHRYSIVVRSQVENLPQRAPLIYPSSCRRRTVVVVVSITLAITITHRKQQSAVRVVAIPFNTPHSRAAQVDSEATHRIRTKLNYSRHTTSTRAPCDVHSRSDVIRAVRRPKIDSAAADEGSSRARDSSAALCPQRRAPTTHAYPHVTSRIYFNFNNYLWKKSSADHYYIHVKTILKLVQQFVIFFRYRYYMKVKLYNSREIVIRRRRGRHCEP